jgi:citrate synthase
MDKETVDDEANFVITKENLETGLRGYPCGYCTTSAVDPLKGLSYAGHPIAEVADWEPEKAIYLLYYGKVGSAEEIKKFADSLKKRAKCSPQVIKHIKLLPREGHPMDLFCAALLICGMLEGTGDYREDCLNLIAKIPEITAAVINYHAGWGDGAPSQPDLGYMDNFVQMLNIPHKFSKAEYEGLKRVFKLFNVLHYDHDGGNLSTFVGKAVASGLASLYGSMNAAMAALAGPRHGRANQDCLDFVKEVHGLVGDNPTASQVEKFIRQRLENKQLVFGFGHALLRVEDPRATIQYDIANKLYPDNPLVKLAALLRTEGAKVLKENPKISNPYPNVDAISGTLLTAAGFPYPEYYTVLFGLSRVVGISIQIVYERMEARGGKGTPIVRPNYFYRDRDTLG